MPFLISLFALFVFFAVPAHAQDAVDGLQIQKLLQFAANNEAFDKNVTAQARALFNRQMPGCPAITRIVRQLPNALSPLTFPRPTLNDRFPAPTDGLWIEHVKVSACGRVRQVNMLAAGQQDGIVVMLALLPGETRADPAIQREAERIASTTVTRSDAACSDTPVIANTRFLSFQGNDNALSEKDIGRGWFEEWEYGFCQKTVTVQLAFTPNETGAIRVTARQPAQ